MELDKLKWYSLVIFHKLNNQYGQYCLQFRPSN